jgi:hypothetical protein
LCNYAARVYQLTGHAALMWPIRVCWFSLGLHTVGWQTPAQVQTSPPVQMFFCTSILAPILYKLPVKRPKHQEK